MATKGELQMIPLRSAVLCVDCDHVSNCTKGECPACGSFSLMSLAKVLNRTLIPSAQIRTDQWTTLEVAKC